MFFAGGREAAMSVVANILDCAAADAIADKYTAQFERAANNVYVSILDARASFESDDERVEMVHDAMMMFDI
jgi:hypothetical protein